MAWEYFSIKDKRVVLDRPCDIIVEFPDGDPERIWGDRWDTLDGMTLTIWRGNREMRVFQYGEWKCCYRDVATTDPDSPLYVREIWPEEGEYIPAEQRQKVRL